MKLVKRGGIAACVIVGAALVAVGCGGSSGGGGGSTDATSAAKDAAALDLVPQDAIGYVTVNADVRGDDWEQFDELATAFKSDFKGVGTELAKSSEEGDDPVDFDKEIDPWLGDSAGAAIIDANASSLSMSDDDEVANSSPSTTPDIGDSSTDDAVDSDSDSGDGSGSSDDPTFIAWFDLQDRDKFEAFLKDQKFEKGKDAGDFETWEGGEDDDDTFFGVNDDYAFFTDSRDQLEERAAYDGDSILDAEGVGDVVDEAGDDSLATIVVSGEGLRKFVKDSDEFKQIGAAKQLKDFNGLAVTFAAEDEGLRVHGYAAGEGEDAGENTDNKVFTDLPGNTLFAVGSHDLGGSLKEAADEFGSSNAQVQQAIGAASGALGIDIDDLAKAFGGDFALSLSTDDEGIGALAGVLAGANSGGGLSGLDPATLAKAASVTLAFEEEGDAADTLDKLVGAVGGLAGAGSTPKEGTAGDFSTKTLDLGGLPLTNAASDDIAAVSVGADVFTEWGDDTLADNDDFTAAWKAADAPDKTAAAFWLDFSRVAKLADIKSADDVTPRGWVGWVEADDSNASFDLFMHIDQK